MKRMTEGGNSTEYERFEYDDGPSGGGYLLPEDELAEYLKNMFGPEYHLSEFTNTLSESTDGRSKYISSFPEIGISEGWAQMTLFSDEDETYIRIDYTYDDNGNLQEENHVSNGAAPWWFEYTYDNNGNIQTMIRYEADGSERYDYICDDEGNVQTCTQLNNDGSIRSRTEYTYDENGNVLTETEYDSDELVISSLSYEYEYYD